MTETWRNDIDGRTCHECGERLGYAGAVHQPLGRHDPIIVTDSVLRCPNGHEISPRETS